MINLDAPGSDRRRRAARLDRNADRRVTAAGIVVAALFLAAAAATALLPPAPAYAAWLPLHLALAGAAGTAVAGVMPFFSASLVAAPPSPAALRAGAVALVAAGAALVATRAIAPSSALPVAGGVSFVAGAALLWWTTMAPLRHALGPSRPIVAVAYGVAVADVIAGAALATLFLGGWMPVVAAWPTLKAAHAWLNLLGFVSLAIAGTLTHLLPTVLGGRIVPRASAAAAVAGLAAGAPLVALGFALSGETGPAAGLVARTGAIAAIAGAAALAWHGVEVARARGRWTTDPGWHRMAIVGLLAAVCWFSVAVAAAGGRVLVAGAAPGGWRLDDVGAPLAVGWVMQALVASWTHLLPSIGPGGPKEHARQRRILGRLAGVRLAAINGGTLLLAAGIPTGVAALVAAGSVLAAAGLAASLALAAEALLAVRELPAAADG